MGKSLGPKVWDAHTVGTIADGSPQLFIGTHLVHGVTSPQAFDMLGDRVDRPFGSADCGCFRPRGRDKRPVWVPFPALLRLPKVAVDGRTLVMQVLGRFDEGFNFADALDDARSAGLELKTFDREFLNKGRNPHWKISPP